MYTHLACFKKTVNPFSTRRGESPAPSLAADEEEAPLDIGSQTATRPSTPPPRAEAFEKFKKSRGSEINQIFLDNKGFESSSLFLFTTYSGTSLMYVCMLCVYIATLNSKKKEVAELSATINTIKKKMDEVRKAWNTVVLSHAWISIQQNAL